MLASIHGSTERALKVQAFRLPSGARTCFNSRLNRESTESGPARQQCGYVDCFNSRLNRESTESDGNRTGRLAGDASIHGSTERALKGNPHPARPAELRRASIHGSTERALKDVMQPPATTAARRFNSRLNRESTERRNPGRFRAPIWTCFNSRLNRESTERSCLSRRHAKHCALQFTAQQREH